MSTESEPVAARAALPSEPAQTAPVRTRSWKPILTLLVLSPAIGELLSGSSPPLQFFNPLVFALLVGLYGCGALIIREVVILRRLNVGGLLLLGAAYGVVEEGLMCKSFFNPYWTDTGFLSVYGRAWGVNWVWAFGLTFYHMAVSIAAPIFLTEALFAEKAAEPWLRRRGRTVAGAAFALVVLLGYMVFDNRQFHLIEMKQSLGLASRLAAPATPLEQFLAGQLTGKEHTLVRKAVSTQTDSPELKHALQDELNRVLPRADLYTPNRFAGVELPEALKRQTAKPPHGDELVRFNRALLEAAFPAILPTRPVYPFRPSWRLTLSCLLVIGAFVAAALKQTNAALPPAGGVRRPWLAGLGCTAGFIVVGFVLPALVEHGARVRAVVPCALWCILALMLGALLRRMDSGSDRLWRRGLWALGVIAPFVFVALLLGLVIGMIGAKSFLGMPLVSLAFAIGIVITARKWKRGLAADAACAPVLASDKA